MTPNEKALASDLADREYQLSALAALVREYVNVDEAAGRALSVGHVDDANELREIVGAWS